jgi:hypothetical protein
MLTIRRSLYGTLAAKYSANAPVHAMSTLVRSNPRKLQFCIFEIQYSIEHISAVIREMWTTRCALNSKFAAKYSAHTPVHAIPTQVPVKFNIITVLDIQASIFNWTYTVDIGDMSTIQYTLYSTIAAKGSLDPPDYAVSTPVPVKSNIITAPLMQASIFNWPYLRCY